METSHDPTAAARAAGLRYSLDDVPGIQRRRTGQWRYLDPDGAPVKDANDLSRIRAIVIPPAWRDVWINPNPLGHLQATGRDSRGRKQYRYHATWRASRAETKFSRMSAFGRALPGLRRRVSHDLELPGLPREKTLAAEVRLLDEALIRVGNEEYVRENNSYGLTTLRDRHVDVCGTTMHFTFRSKGGAQHEVDVRDRRVARIVRRLQDLPGQHLSSISTPLARPNRSAPKMSMTTCARSARRISRPRMSAPGPARCSPRASYEIWARRWLRRRQPLPFHRQSRQLRARRRRAMDIGISWGDG